MVHAEHAVYEFSGFRLDTRRRELSIPGQGPVVPLKPRQYETLLYFVERAGQLIEKSSLLTALWPDTVVEENNLNQHITALRQLLGEDRGGRRFIMNVRGRGYQFVPDVMRLDEVRAAMPPSPTMRPPPTTSTAAWQCFQQAMFLIGMDDPAQWSAGVERLMHATRLDPQFASALATLATLRLRLISIDWPDPTQTFELARTEAARAVALRPDLAFTQMAAGSVAAMRGDWIDAEERFQAAVCLDEDWPVVSAIHAAHVLLPAGHVRRAANLLRSSESRVHGMIGILLIHAFAATLAGDDDRARSFLGLMQAMGAQPHHPQLDHMFAWLARRDGRFDEAAALLSRRLPTHMRTAGAEVVIAEIERALAGEVKPSSAIDAIGRLLEAVELPRIPYPLRHFLLTTLGRLGAIDRAYRFAHLNLDYFQSQGMVSAFWVCLWPPIMREFRDDSRFGALCARLRLEEYWARFGGPG